MVQWSNVVYWTATADPRTNSFQACLFATGGVMLSYLDMDPAVLSWSTESIGYEDRTGASGVQISWNEIPVSGTNYYIPVSCHTVPTVPEDHSWSYVGCFADNQGGVRDLTGAHVVATGVGATVMQPPPGIYSPAAYSPQIAVETVVYECAFYCRGLGYQYMGLQVSWPTFLAPTLPLSGYLMGQQLTTVFVCSGSRNAFVTTPTVTLHSRIIP